LIFDIPLSVIWISVAVILGIVEALTLGLATIWFALGAVVAWFFAMLGFGFMIQLSVFLLTSIVLVYYTRPFAKEVLKIGHTRTNADRLIGEVGVVIKRIDPVNSTGQIKILGEIWSARTDDKKAIEKDEKVRVKVIKGVKVIVEKIK